MKERRVWHLLMQIPTVTGCISLFQFCSETSVENKSASFFCCSVQASLLLYVCKYNQPACIKAARQEEFPLKKKRLALDQRFWTKMAPMHHPYGALFAGVIRKLRMYSILWGYSPLTSVFLSLQHTHCLVSLQRTLALFNHINTGVIFSLNNRYHSIK